MARQKGRIKTIKRAKSAKRAKRAKRAKNPTRRNNRKRGKTRRGGYGPGECPFVGKPWNGVGPPSNSYVPKPWYSSNNANFYPLSKYGIRVGGIKPYPGDDLYKNLKGGKKGGKKVGMKTRKSKYLGLKGGGLSFSDFIPNFALNIIRPIETAFWNKSPIIGREWRGLTKKVSQLPSVQPKLNASRKNKMDSKVDSELNIKKIQQNAKNYVKGLSK